jgi:hypothetical protein
MGRAVAPDSGHYQRPGRIINVLAHKMSILFQSDAMQRVIATSTGRATVADLRLAANGRDGA